MNDHKILIIDYRVGNHQSVLNALKCLGYNFLSSARKEDIEKADVYILPGVGAFAEAMKNLEQLDVVKTLTEQVLEKKKPILGICLGMQVLSERSQEYGPHRGLGWIKGEVVRIDTNNKNFKVPHVGWNDIKIVKKDPLFTKLDGAPNFYFDHSYHFVCDDSFVSSKCYHGIDMVASLQKDNIFGVQFHPEKSQNNGSKFFRSFFNYIENNKPVKC
ncbi:MAG: imidazole glycerol phosphate synthase subunit HisH [Patescibacteria group bacterium]